MLYGTVGVIITLLKNVVDTQQWNIIPHFKMDLATYVQYNKEIAMTISIATYKCHNNVSSL